MTDSFLYIVSGWTVCSTRPLPYLLEAVDKAAGADIDLTFGRLDPTEGGKKYGPFHIFGPNLVEIRLPSGLHIRIADGCRLTVDVPEHCTMSEVHTYLFGPAFSVLAQQRRRPPLHASAIEVGNGALAVAGDSGAGKSTTARWLMGRGYRLLTDDQLIVDPESGLAHPSYPATKMWGDVAALLGKSTDDSMRVKAGVDKYHFDVADQFVGGALPLRAVFILRPDGGLKQPEARRLPLPEAIGALNRFVHYAEIAKRLGAQPVMFHWAAQIAGRSPVYIIRRPEEPAAIEALIDLLLSLYAEAA